MWLFPPSHASGFAALNRLHLKHRTEQWTHVFIQWNLTLKIVTYRLFLCISGWCNQLGLKSPLGYATEMNSHILPFFVVFTMGCSFIISICLSLIFRNHISRSNDGGLKNFVIKTGVMRPFEAKSRNDRFWDSHTALWKLWLVVCLFSLLDVFGYDATNKIISCTI